MTETQYLSNWQSYPFNILETRLEFDLAPKGTKVRSEIRFNRKSPGDLVLDGSGLRTNLG